MKLTRHKITFASSGDAECVEMAMLGYGNKAIARSTGLTDCQITYRLSKAKAIEKNKHGYRVAWRNGESAISQQVRKDIGRIIRMDVQRRLPIQILHPEPKMVSV
jgi:hypothetical protein